MQCALYSVHTSRRTLIRLIYYNSKMHVLLCWHHIQYIHAHSAFILYTYVETDTVVVFFFSPFDADLVLYVMSFVLNYYVLHGFFLIVVVVAVARCCFCLI